MNLPRGHGRNDKIPKLNHIASIAQDPLTTGKFYATIFNMTYGTYAAHIGYAATAREGYVGLNFNPILPGRPGPVGLDHFGIEVEDVEESFAMAEKISDGRVGEAVGYAALFASGHP